MAQPALGVMATAIVIAISLGFISLFDAGTFGGWVAFFNLCLIPMQIVIVVLWGANPSFVARFTQPLKGIVLLLVTMIAAAIIAPLALQAVGEGVSPPGPIPSHYAVIAVPTTFYMAIMFGGWPFMGRIRNPLLAGLTLLLASYLVTYAIFRVFFDYDFMQGAPVYLQSAPHGMFNAIMALVFYVTILAGMFVVPCFDLWPLTTMPGVMKQPVLGLAWTAIAIVIAAVAMNIGVGMMGMDPMAFLTKVTAPFIFGTIIVLNMLQNSLFANLAQPVKGILNTIAAAAIGVALALLYGALSPMISGRLASGPPTYDFEVWLANALLSVTFPFLIFHAAYFGYWPLAKRPEPAGQPART